MSNITEEDLNIKSNLTTENYAFELIGLKDPVDLRKFSKALIKIDDLILNLDETSLKKLNITIPSEILALINKIRNDE